MIRVVVWDVMGVVLLDAGLNLELISLTKKLRDQGIMCVLGTNLSSEGATRIWDQLGLKNHFDEIYPSSRMGAWKPSYEFFKAVQDELEVFYDDLKPAHVLFFDDSRDNVAAAGHFGWRAEQFESMEKLHDDLRTYKVGFEQGDQ